MRLNVEAESLCFLVIYTNRDFIPTERSCMVHYRTINRDKKFIAFFSPKCACTTLKAWFIASLNLNQRIELSALGAYMIPACDVDKYLGYRKIFFIRNPFHRLVSFYCNFVVRETHDWCFADHEGRETLKGKTFAELVVILAELAEQGKPFQHHLRPQLEGVEGVEFDNVVLVEDLDAQIAVLNRELGIGYRPKRLNATFYGKTQSGPLYDLEPQQIAKLGAPNRALFYNDQLLDIVLNVFRDDIKYYNLYSRAELMEDG